MFSISFIILFFYTLVNYNMNNSYQNYEKGIVGIIVAQIDERVNYIREYIREKNIDYYEDVHKDRYEDGKLIYRHAEYPKEMEYDSNGEIIGGYSYYDEKEDKYYSEFVGYDMYYDENEKLIYADIIHYRGAMYSIYFNDDELLYVEINGGMFARGDLYIKGGMKELYEGIKNDSRFSFILLDIENCLKYAYEQICINVNCKLKNKEIIELTEHTIYFVCCYYETFIFLQ